LLRQLLGNNDVESLNPSNTGGQTMQSTLPISQSGEAKRAGFEVIGTIQVTKPDSFESLVEAYGLHVQQQNGGYTADALDSARPESSGPFTTSEAGARGFAVAQGVLDAASLLADVKSNYGHVINIGTITVMERQGKK
jgi:hypothetical protein